MLKDAALITEAKIDEWIVRVFEVTTPVSFSQKVCWKYIVRITMDKKTYDRSFYFPLETEKFTDKVSDMIIKKIKEVKEKNLLESPDHKEFAFFNEEFKGVIDTTI